MALVKEHQLYKHFDDFLNESYGYVSVAGLHYQTSRAFKMIDPIAYEEDFKNWVDSLLKDELLFEKDGLYYDSEDK